MAPGAVPARLLSIDSGQARLLAAHCEDCLSWSFPCQDSCAKCGSEAVVDSALPQRGRLWSYTIQTFRPPSPPFASAPEDGPDNFVPFGVGMVEFDNGLCVHGRLTESDSSRLDIGMTVETVVVPLEAGSEELIYAFQPIRGGAQ